MNQISPRDTYTTGNSTDVARYARCIESSKRVRWDITDDVFQGRDFDTDQKYLPDGITKADQFTTLSDGEKRYLSQIQGRTYANMFGLAERFVNAKILEISRDHFLGDQTKLEALVRFSDEEIKHQEMFRQIERRIGDKMAPGYQFLADPNDVAREVLGKCTWSVLALTCMIELFTQSHYRESIDRDDNLSPLFKDVFRFHWMEESQHAILDELEWERENDKLSVAGRDMAVDNLIALAVFIDGVLQTQSKSDVAFFGKTCGRSLTQDEVEALETGVLKAYRWQFIFSGVEHPQFCKILGGMITEEQGGRIGAVLAQIS
jgi:hypothetical protein